MGFFDDEGTERSALYKLFSSLFIEGPSEEVIVTMKAMFQMKFDETTDEIGADFVRLFQGHGSHLKPFESFYNYPFGDTPRVWGRAASEVQGAYQSAGVMIDEEINLIPDHISAELLFMAFLTEHDLGDQQKRFLEDHLLRWVPELCEEILKHAHTTFYREVAELLKEFITSDYKEFGNGGEE